jgi:hypothetical protein
MKKETIHTILDQLRFSSMSKGTQPKANSPSSSQRPERARLRVLLTGSTGNLGCYILDWLLHNSSIEKTTCLNRSADASVEQRRNHEIHGLETANLLLNGTHTDKLEFLAGDLSQQPTLGFAPRTYDQLTSSVNIILHNGWPVDFQPAFLQFRTVAPGREQPDRFRPLLHMFYDFLLPEFDCSCWPLGRYVRRAGESPRSAT